MQTMEIKSDGSIKDAKPMDKKKFTLQELQEAVNGMIKIIDIPFHDCYLITNEEGALLKLPINHWASQIYEGSYGLANQIVGDVLVCDKEFVD